LSESRGKAAFGGCCLGMCCILPIAYFVLMFIDLQLVYDNVILSIVGGVSIIAGIGIALGLYNYSQRTGSGYSSSKYSSSYSGPTSVGRSFLTSSEQMLFQQGLNASQRGNFYQAIEYWEKVASAAPKNVAVWNNLGSAYVQVKNFSKAEKSFQKLIELKPNAENWERLGFIYALKGASKGDVRGMVQDDLKKSIICFEKSLNYNPNNDPILLKVGLGYAALGDLSKAERYMQKYLNRNPSDSKTRQMFESMKRDLGGRNIFERTEKEQSFCNKCGAKLEDNTKFCTQCGAPIKSRQDTSSINLTKVSELQKERIKDYPGFPDGKDFQNEEAKKLFNQAELQIQKYNVDQAIPILKRVLEIEPEVPRTYQLLSNIYQQKGNYSQAKKYAKKAIKLNPNQVKACEILENIYAHEGKVQKQDAVFNQLKQLGSVYANYLADWGFRIANAPKVPDRQEQNEMAKHLWKRALAIDPNNQQAKAFLASFSMLDGIDAELDRFQGDYDRAIEYYSKKLELNPNDEMAMRMIRMAELRKMGIDFRNK
jgi:tetratricopeptide (TPR) repeat protein